MPTQETYAGSPSAKETKQENQSGTSEREALAVEKPSLSDMPTHTENEEMSKSEALAIAWTGLEALALSGEAQIYRSRKSGSVWIQLLATDYDSANGLRSIGTK